MDFLGKFLKSDRSKGWFHLKLGGEADDKIERVFLCSSPIDALSMAEIDRDGHKGYWLLSDRFDFGSVVRLSAFPNAVTGFSHYIEEWISSKSFYWKSVTNANGAVFSQRRYDLESIHSRLVVNGGKIDEILFVAEKPIKEPGLNDEGRMLHN